MFISMESALVLDLKKYDFFFKVLLLISNQQNVHIGILPFVTETTWVSSEDLVRQISKTFRSTSCNLKCRYSIFKKISRNHKQINIIGSWNIIRHNQEFQITSHNYAL